MEYEGLKWGSMEGDEAYLIPHHQIYGQFTI